MAGNSRIPHVEVMREAARRAVDGTSLRQTAAAIGLSPTGLRKFLDGTQPYTPTVHRLREWYLIHGEGIHGLTEERLEIVLDVLTEDVPVRAREVVIKSLREFVATACYDVPGIERPYFLAPA